MKKYTCSTSSARLKNPPSTTGGNKEKLPDWQRLWDDFVQEETRMGQGLGSSNSAPQIVDEEALGLTWKSKGKAKKKKGGKKNLGMSKVKCFICHKQGHSSS